MPWTDMLASLVDETTILETSAFAVGSSLSALLYYLYRRSENQAKKVEDAPAFEINDDLTSIVRESPFSNLPYVAINGRVSSSGDPLSCNADRSIKGVIWRKSTTEHKDVWGKYTQTWQNNKRQISSITDSMPFNLSGENSDLVIKVVDPMESAWLDDAIEVVHENFTPSTSGVMDSIVGYVSGDRLKGFTVTEEMLRLGSNLCAIGELAYEDNILHIRPPSSSTGGDYIVSKYTQKEIVSKIRAKATAWKVFAILLGAASVTALYFMVRRLKKRFDEMQNEVRMRDELNEIRQQRTAATGRLNRGNAQENNEQEVCIICLTNPRECVLLDCGHICVCVDCLQVLPTPKECPMCRSAVLRTVPLYHA